jgi:DNA recombination protein RmuC
MLPADAGPYLLIGAALAALLGILVAGWWARRRYADALASREPEVQALRERLVEARDELDLARDAAERERARNHELEQGHAGLLAEQARLRTLVERLPALERALADRESELAALRSRSEDLRAEHAALESRSQSELRAGGERLALLERVREEFGQAFRALAGEFLDQRAQRLDETTRQAVEPLKGELERMQQAVRHAYQSEARERALLGREVEALRALNQRLGSEAQQLTRALRGDTRVQGAWGEMLLEQALESAGLVAGRDYSLQVVLQDEEGRRPRPDVLVHLPGERLVIIDAKVSLSAYERALRQEDEAQQQRELGEHAASLRRHIDELAGRDYSQLAGGRALEMVLLFVPLESALAAALAQDPTLPGRALERQVALVSPMSLMVALRAVAQVWQQEQRHRHAEDIARRAGRLYDRFVAFVADLEGAREAVQRALASLDQAHSRLSGGRGNLVRQAEQLRELGARSSRRLPAALTDVAEGDEGKGDPDGDR